MSLSGRLEEHDLPEILHFLALNNKTGKLVLTRRQGQGLIVVRMGRILYAVSSAVHETFGNILVRRGLVSDETLATALERQHLAPEPRRLGSVLVEMGRLTDSEIEDVVRQQTTRVVQELCRWPSGSSSSRPWRWRRAGWRWMPRISWSGRDQHRPGADRSGDPPRRERARIASPGDGLGGSARPARRGHAAPPPGGGPPGVARPAPGRPRRPRPGSRAFRVRGRGNPGGSVPAAIEGLSVPLHEPSVFAEAIGRREVCRGPLADNAVNGRLTTVLGGGPPDDAVVVPMLVRESVVMIFYGDNLPSGRPIGTTEGLEWAFVEASLDMEKDALDERIRAFDNAQGRRALAVPRPGE